MYKVLYNSAVPNNLSKYFGALQPWQYYDNAWKIKQDTSLIEKDKIPSTNELIESNVNHITDVIFFFIGSVLAVKYGHKLFINNQTLRYSVLAIMFLSFLQDIKIN